MCSRLSNAWLNFGCFAGYATFCFLADIDPSDDGNPAMRPGNSLPRSYGKGSFPIDSINLWPWLSGGMNRSSPRKEIVLGKMTVNQPTGCPSKGHFGHSFEHSSECDDSWANFCSPTRSRCVFAQGGSMIVEGGWKIILGKQNPDWWYGPYAPNCTSAGTNGDHPDNCDEGCLFNIEQDVGEHVNLRTMEPSRFAMLKTKLERQVAAEPWDDEVAYSLLHDPTRSGTYDDEEEIAAATAAMISPRHAVDGNGALIFSTIGDACTAMQTKWQGFFGPYDDLPSPQPSPPPPPHHNPPPSPTPPPRNDCAWEADADYAIGEPNELPSRDSTTREECCAICWDDPRCAVAVFSGQKAKGRCQLPPGRNCCWLKTHDEVKRKGSDPGVMSCMPNRTDAPPR